MKLRDLLGVKQPAPIVAHLMKTSVYTCLPDDSLNRAAQIMWDNDCGSVPVVDAEGHLQGMLTDRDVCMAAYTTDIPLSRATAQNAMSKSVYTCRPEDALDYAERLMQLYQIRRLPVVDNQERVVGILSLGDIARYFSRGDNSVDAKSLAKTLAAISRERVKKPFVA
ncbi:MAG TPA: CBS domain-containing protein [Polyangiaceae bacterium]|jgi:CBS domain-containing protein